MIFKRYISSADRIAANLSLFTSRKVGTGSGPFVELPAFQLLHDSIVLRIPSSSIVYSKVNKIQMLNVPPGTSAPFLRFNELPTGYTELSTLDQPVNVVCTTGVSTKNIKVIELDNYKKGWKVNNATQQVLCYSGDLSFDQGHVLGRGIVALMGQGPISAISLNNKDEVLLAKESILAYEDSVSMRLHQLNTSIMIPPAIKKYILSLLGGYYDTFLPLLALITDKDKIYCRVKGPGTILTQSSYIPGSSQHCKDNVIHTK